MSKTMVTLIGNVATQPRRVVTDTGTDITSFRLAVPTRRQTRQGEWADGPTSFYTVSCFDALALNSAASVKVGQPIVVHGELTVREWSKPDRSGISVDVKAHSLGHDQRLGVATFERVVRSRVVEPDDDAVQASLAALDDVPVEVDPVTGEIMPAPDETSATDELAATG